MDDCNRLRQQASVAECQLREAEKRLELAEAEEQPWPEKHDRVVERLRVQVDTDAMLVAEHLRRLNEARATAAAAKAEASRNRKAAEEARCERERRERAGAWAAEAATPEERAAWVRAVNEKLKSGRASELKPTLPTDQAPVQRRRKSL